MSRDLLRARSELLAALRGWSRGSLFILVGTALTALLVVPVLHAQPTEEQLWLVALWLWWGFGVAWVLLRTSISPPALGLLGIMLVYIVIPATIAVAAGKTGIAGVDYTGGTLGALQISTAAQFAITAGLIIGRRLHGSDARVRRVEVETTSRRLNRTALAAIALSVAAVIALTVTSGADITQYVAILGGASYGSFSKSSIDTPSGYLGDLTGIASVCLMIAVVALSCRGRRHFPFFLIAIALLVAAFLIAGGVRARLVVPLLAAALLWIKLRRRPERLPLRTLSIVAVCGVLLFGGVIGLARGPNHPQITPAALVGTELGTGSDLFAPLAGLVQTVPAQHDFLLGSSYLDALYLPIPRATWPGKPQGAIIDLTGRFADTRNGESFPEYGEMYANFGVVGVIAGCLLFAIVLEWLWARFCTTLDGHRILLYPVLLSVLLQIFTRDYAASQLAGFAGVILAALVLQRCLKLKVWPRWAG